MQAVDPQSGAVEKGSFPAASVSIATSWVPQPCDDCHFRQLKLKHKDDGNLEVHLTSLSASVVSAHASFTLGSHLDAAKNHIRGASDLRCFCLDRVIAVRRIRLRV